MSIVVKSLGDDPIRIYDDDGHLLSVKDPGRSLVVTVTREFLLAGQSSNGGWRKSQLRLVGVSWPPKSGWMATIIGKDIRRCDADEFLKGGGSN